MSAYCSGCGVGLDAWQSFCTACGTPAAARADIAPPAPTALAGWCTTCGGDGRGIAATEVFCRECRWLRPLAPDYALPPDAFVWSLDAQAMATLQRITPLKAMAAKLSHKIGRPWLEASVDGIRLGPDQLPDIFQAAVNAARALSLPRLPELYVSGEQMWDCLTLGSEQQQFIVIGSILTNFRGADLRYVLGREMGHVAAGHALWRTVLQFLNGRQAGNRTIMGHGALQMLNPGKLIEGAIDAPLMAWARHAEITADRAGALACGDRAAARRVATQWSLKSFPLYARLDLAALERDIVASDDRQMALSEWTMSSTPYLARRLRLLDEYFASETLQGWRAVIDFWTRPADAPPPPPEPERLRVACVACGTGLKIARADLDGRTSARVRCINPACGKVLELKPRPPKPQPAPVPPPGIRLACPACHGAVVAPADVLADRKTAAIRCPDPECGTVLTLRRLLDPRPRPRPRPRVEETAE